MHEIHKSELFPGVTLTCVKTEKFKTGCVTVNLIAGLSRDTAALSALLPRVLRRGCTELPDMEQIAAALDELYGARIEPLVRKKGELQCIGFFADFPDDRFIPSGESVLEETINLICKLLLYPEKQEGLLRSDYVDSEKSNLIDDIRAAINDKRGYSIDRLLEEMCAEEAYGVGKYGREEEAAAITPETLTAHYRSLISDARIEIFYCGSAEQQRVESAIRAALSDLPERKESKTPKTNVILRPAECPPRRFTETLDVSQGKLTVGFRLGKAMENPDYPAFLIFNSLYGGSVTSKLFLNVREKLSLCYYASSILDKHKGIMIVASGVEFSKFDTALGEILAQLESVKKGDVSDWEFTSAKRYVVTSLLAAMDRPGGLEDLYFDSTIAAAAYDPVELCGRIEAVTLNRVIDTASEIEPDSIYFLCDSEFGIRNSEFGDESDGSCVRD